MAASRLSFTGSRLSAKRLDGELARLGDLFLGAAAGVLGLGLGAQVGVGHRGVLGLEFGQAFFGARLQRRGGVGLAVASGAWSASGQRCRGVGSFGFMGGIAKTRDRDGNESPVFKRVIAAFLSPGPPAAAGRSSRSSRSSTEALQRCQSASSRRSRLVGRPCSMAWAGSAARRRCLGGCLARGDARGGLRVQRLRHRRRAAQLAQAQHLHLARDLAACALAQRHAVARRAPRASAWPPGR